MDSSKNQQGQVSTQADEPKDDEQDQLQKHITAVLEPISCYTPDLRKEVLTAALEQVSRTTEATEKLIALEEQVCNACDKVLDIKAKAVIAVLAELSSVSGVVNDIDYGVDLLHSTYRGKDFLDEAQKQSPDDSDLAFLSDVYDLANIINRAEYKR